MLILCDEAPMLENEDGQLILRVPSGGTELLLSMTPYQANAMAQRSMRIMRSFMHSTTYGRPAGDVLAFPRHKKGGQ
ncbi:hypothetical protein GCM10011371_18420 [Novosphingobium marinum]|uniref:Uncharacterized protein n=1 Tax=Novosphingobium marinum TaxID=1514948 RepID=A0A7Y9XWN3_9SPHN|nr:hypothetical protein [Novosphingobium marinum]NYH95954.1 hypothetical protein [Novosphingobium marinum]GGC31293.1 hypothetical protein GCM10011371_18420 [Novosphingobium marinum]